MGKLTNAINRKHRLPACVLCGFGAMIELHHIVNRGRTVGSNAARSASDAKELTVLLCKLCHGKAHNKRVREELLNIQIQQYGREAVQAALDQVQSHMRTRLGIELPKEK